MYNFIFRPLTIVICSIFLSCGNSSSTKNTDQSLNFKTEKQTLDIVEEPYSKNQEWNEFRKFYGMFALHLRPSNNIKSRMYELKYEFFKDGKKNGELILGYDRLGTIANTLVNDSLLHFYAFPLSDTAYKFVYNSIPGNTNSILLPLNKKTKETFKWIHLSKGNNFELKDSAWMPFMALTQPYIETCTPDKCYYCVLPDNVNHYEDWGSTMGIMQYFVFSFRLL